MTGPGREQQLAGLLDRLSTAEMAHQPRKSREAVALLVYRALTEVAP